MMHYVLLINECYVLASDQVQIYTSLYGTVHMTKRPVASAILHKGMWRDIELASLIYYFITRFFKDAVLISEVM
jgi:hypothetical protein